MSPDLSVQSSRERLKRLLIACALFLVVGSAYALIYRQIGLSVPCLLHMLTGFNCPGCGVSRMCISLFSGDIRSAWHYNAAVLCLLPLGVAIAADVAVRYVREGTRQPHVWARCMGYFMIVVLLAFGVVRNIVPGLKL